MSAPDDAARAEIAQIARTYARGMDRQQADVVASLFTENGRLALYDGEPDEGRLTVEWRGREAITAALRQGRARYSATTHFLGQQTLTAKGDGYSGETYCLAHHIYQRDDRRYNRVMSIRYHDVYVHMDGRWLIDERRLAVDWIEYRPLGSAAELGPS
jgi:uncharacterized protein (TIGR02246 family)